MFLTNIVGEDQLSTLSPDVRTKLEDALCKAVRSRSQAEEQLLHVQQDLRDIQFALTTEKFERTNLKQKNDQLQSELERQRDQINHLKKENSEKENEAFQFKVKHSELQHVVESEKRLLELKTQQLQTLQEFHSKLTETYNALKEETNVNFIKYEEANRAEKTSRLQIQSLTSELERCQAENARLSREVREMKEELTNVQWERNETIRKVTLDASKGNALAAEYASVKEILQARVETLEKELKEILEKLAISRQVILEVKHTRDQLIQEHADTIDRCHSEMEQLKEHSQEVFEELSKLSDEFKVLEQEKTTLAETLQEHDERNAAIIEELKSHITELGKELETANHVIAEMNQKNTLQSNVHEMSPSLAAVRQMMNAGMTFTQVFHSLVTSKDELLQVKQEYQMLKDTFQAAMAELDKREPQLLRQKDEYHRAMETIKVLEASLEQSRTDHERWQKEREGSKRNLSFLERERTRNVNEIARLSQQVRVLLGEVEVARGGSVMSQENEDPNVITFRSIEDLQKENQRLTNQLQSTVEELEKKCQLKYLEEIDSLKLQIQRTSEEIEGLRAMRNRQDSLIQSLVEQQERYKKDREKVEVTQEVVEVEKMVTSPVKRTQTVDEIHLVEATNTIKRLSDMLNESQAKSDETIKKLESELKSSREVAEAAKIENVKLNSKIEFNEKHLACIKSNLEVYKKERDALQERANKLNGMLEKSEESIQTLKKEKQTLDAKLARIEAEKNQAIKERDTLKNRESSVLKDAEANRKHELSLRLMSNDIKSLQALFERKDAESRSGLSRRLEATEKERDQHQVQLENEIKRYTDAVAEWRNEILAVQGKLDEERSQHASTKDELMDAYSKIHMMELERSNRIMGNTETALPSSSAISNAPVNPALEADLQELRLQLTCVTGQLNHSKELVDVMRNERDATQALADSFEKQLKESSEELKIVSAQLMVELQEKDSKIEELIANHAREIEAMKQDSEMLQLKIDEGLTKTAALEELLHALRSENKINQDQLEAARQSETLTASNIKEKTDLIRELEEKLVAELRAHTTTKEAMASLSDQLSELNADLNEAHGKLQSSENAFSVIKATWLEQEVGLNEEITRLRERIAHLEAERTKAYADMNEVMNQIREKMEENKKETVSNTEGLTETELKDAYVALLKELENVQANVELQKQDSMQLHKRIEELNERNLLLEKSVSNERVQAEAYRTLLADELTLLTKGAPMEDVIEHNRELQLEKQELQQRVNELNSQIENISYDHIPGLREKEEELKQLESENATLKSEVLRWQGRVNELRETSTKGCLEDMKRIGTENEQLQKKLAAKQEEMDQLNAEMTKLMESLSNAQAQLQEATDALAKERNEFNTSVEESERKLALQSQHTAKLRTEVVSQKTKVAELTTKNKELQAQVQCLEDQMGELNSSKEDSIQNLAKQCTQLKRIGRKYKVQSDEQAKELEDLTANLNTLKEEFEASKNEVDTLKLENAKMKSEQDELKGELDSIKSERDKLKDDGEQLKVALEEKSKGGTIDESNEKLKEEMEALKSAKLAAEQELEKSQERIQELVKTETKEKNLIQAARNQILKLQSQRDTQTREFDEIKSKMLAAQNVKEESHQAMLSQLNEKIRKLETDLTEATNKNNDYSQQVNELSLRMSALQRQLGAKDKTSPATKSPAVNITPIAAIPQQRVPPQSSNVTPPVSSAPSRLTPTASIRPMTSTPTTQRLAVVSALPIETEVSIESDTEHTVPSAIVLPSQDDVPLSIPGTSLGIKRTRDETEHRDPVPTRPLLKRSRVLPTLIAAPNVVATTSVAPSTESSESTETIWVEESSQRVTPAARVLPNVSLASDHSDATVSRARSETVIVECLPKSQTGGDDDVVICDEDDENSQTDADSVTCTVATSQGEDIDSAPVSESGGPDAENVQSEVIEVNDDDDEEVLVIADDEFVTFEGTAETAGVPEGPVEEGEITSPSEDD